MQSTLRVVMIYLFKCLTYLIHVLNIILLKIIFVNAKLHSSQKISNPHSLLLKISTNT